MASRLLTSPHTMHPPAIKGSARPGHIIIVTKPLRGISHPEGGISLMDLVPGTRIMVLDIAPDRVPTALCMCENNDRRWPWVVSQIDYFISRGKLLLTQANG